MRKSILAITAGTLLFTLPAVAQDQGTAEGTPLGDLMGPEMMATIPAEADEEAAAPADDFFKLGETVVITYEPLNISEAVGKLAKEVCGEDGLDDCTFNGSAVTEIAEANSTRLKTLIQAETEIIELRAATEVAKHRWVAAEALRKAQEAELAAGIVYDADDMADVMSDVGILSAELDRIAALVEGEDPDIEDAMTGLDQEVAALGEKLSAIENELADTRNNADVLRQTVMTWCSVDGNYEVTLCRLLREQLPGLIFPSTSTDVFQSFGGSPNE